MTFGGFTFASDVLLGRVAVFYGLAIPAAENETSLADFLRARLPREPTLGDRIRCDDVELVVRAMNGERITKVDLELAPHERGLAFMSGSSPA